MSTASTREALLALIRPVVESGGLDLEDVEVVAAGKRRLVRLLVDRDGGLDLDTVAEVSHAASAALDAADGATGTDGPLGRAPYVLEVSSPGVDRPLTSARDFARNVGRVVRIRIEDRELSGTVLAADDDVVTLDSDDGERRVALADVQTGRVVLPW